RQTLAVLGVILLASVGAATFNAASRQPAKRSAELENFHLVGPTGHAYSIESFPSGSVLAIYFGYTTCLRSCPTALNSIAEAIDRLGKRRASVQPVFIDMDPERAALVSLPAYMAPFGPSFLGLTGSPDDIEQAAKSFNVKLERIQLSDDPTVVLPTRGPPVITSTFEPSATRMASFWLSASASFVRFSTQELPYQHRSQAKAGFRPPASSASQQFPAPLGTGQRETRSLCHRDR